MDALDVWIRPDEACVALTASYRLIQRKTGHRYSVDDLLVAHLACTSGPAPSRVLDLGCGVGSVLLMVAWANPAASLVGVEAQEESIALAARNVVLDACSHRVELRRGDLREPSTLADLAPFDLVTGTPPYFDPLAATPCSDPQRAHAKFELRGGIEAYAEAASRALTEDGRFVVCAPSLPEGRWSDALASAGLHCVARRSVLPGPARAPFLELLVCARSAADTVVHPALVLRESDGRRTREHASIREWFGVRASER